MEFSDRIDYTWSWLKPFYRVYIGKPDGKPWMPYEESYEITNMVLDVSVNMSGTQDTGSASITIDNKDNIHNDFITISKSRVKIDMGYMDTNPEFAPVVETIFTGVTTSKNHFDTKESGEFLSLECADMSDIMRNVKITKTYEGMTFFSILSEFAKMCYPDDPEILVYNLSGAIPDSVTNFVYTSGTESALEVDQTPVWEIVVQLCDEWGLATWFDRYGKWHVDAFGTNSLGKQQTVYVFERGKNLGQFTGHMSTPASVIGTVEVVAYKEDEQEIKLGSFSNPLENVIQNAVLTINNDKIISNEYASYLARKRLALEQSQYKNIEISNQFGIPHIQNGDFIEIQGKGVWDDTYWIRSITHSINKKSGYVINIKADQIPFVISIDGKYSVPPQISENKVIIDESKNCEIELSPPIAPGSGNYDGTKEVNRFGWRVHPVYGNAPYLGNDGQMHTPPKQFHNGIDIDAGFNVPVLAAHAGKITALGYDGQHKSPKYTDSNGKKVSYGTEGTGYGNYITIDGDMCGKTLQTKYAHLCCSPGNHGFLTTLKVGDSVSTGQTIGYVGDTGLAYGPHLHFELRIGEGIVPGDVGELVDPALYIEEYH